MRDVLTEMEVLFVTFKTQDRKDYIKCIHSRKSGLIFTNAYDSCHLCALSMEGQPVQLEYLNVNKLKIETAIV